MTTFGPSFTSETRKLCTGPQHKATVQHVVHHWDVLVQITTIMQTPDSDHRARNHLSADERMFNFAPNRNALRGQHTTLEIVDLTQNTESPQSQTQQHRCVTASPHVRESVSYARATCLLILRRIHFDDIL